MVERLRVRMVVLLQKNLGLEEMVLLLRQHLPPLQIRVTVVTAVTEVEAEEALVDTVKVVSAQVVQGSCRPGLFLPVVLQLQEVEEMEVLVEKALPVLASCTTIHPKSLLSRRFI